MATKKEVIAVSEMPGISAGDIARMEVHASKAANLLKHLAHESRLLILCFLWEHELSVGEINERVPLSQSALSQHLALLREEGLIASRRQAQNVYYRLVDPNAAQILAVLHALYCGKDEKKKK